MFILFVNVLTVDLFSHKRLECLRHLFILVARAPGKSCQKGSSQKSRPESVRFGHQAGPFVTTRPAAKRGKDSQLFFSPCQAAVSLQRTPFGLQAAYLRQSLACWHWNNGGENHSLELQKPKALTLLLWAIWHLGPAPAPFQQLSVTYTHTHTCRYTHTYMCMYTNTNAHRHTYLTQGRHSPGVLPSKNRHSNINGLITHTPSHFWVESVDGGK